MVIGDCHVSFLDWGRNGERGGIFFFVFCELNVSLFLCFEWWLGMKGKGRKVGKGRKRGEIGYSG